MLGEISVSSETLPCLYMYKGNLLVGAEYWKYPTLQYYGGTEFKVPRQMTGSFKKNNTFTVFLSLNLFREHKTSSKTTVFTV